MKLSSKTLMMAAFFLLLTSAAQAGGEHQKPADNSSPEFERIKSLEGRWTSTTSMFGKPNERVYTEYEVTAGGSAVLERIFPGTPNEMISVYYDDNGKLAMTHYCIMRNRPNLKLVGSTDDTISLAETKTSGKKSKGEPSMSHVAITFKDKNNFSVTCGGNNDGKENSEAMTMEYKRVRK